MDPSLLSLPGPSQYRQFTNAYPKSQSGHDTTNTTARPSSSLSPSSSASGSGSNSNSTSRSASEFRDHSHSHSHPHAHGHGQGYGVDKGYSFNGLNNANNNGRLNSSYTSTTSTSTAQTPVLQHLPPSHSNPGNHGPLVEPHQDLNDFLETFWTRQMENVENEEHDAKGNVSLPLARIKKVMKSDEEVKMISAEVPIMFSKACEVFISELTCRAWLVAESHKRRTLQKSDVAAAIAHSDMFDFLIDIVPRDGEGGDGSGAATGEAEQVDVEEGGEVDVEADREEEEGDGEELYREFVEE